MTRWTRDRSGISAFIGGRMGTKHGHKTPESTWEGRRTVCKYQAKLFIILHFHKVIAISSFEVLKECIEKVSAENKIHN